MRCPNCGNKLDEDNYCDECMEFFENLDDDFEDEPDYDSMVNNGEEICLNCTYWSVSPYGRAHGMYCITHSWRKLNYKYGKLLISESISESISYTVKVYAIITV